MKPQQLQEHIYQTYLGLRVGLCGLAFAFPFLLFGIGWLNHIDLQGSMSEYYFSFAPHSSDLRIFPGRVVFVGILFALGVGLILYKGLSKSENWALNIAGIFALVAALYPMQSPDYCHNCGSNRFSYVHETAGFIVFGCLAFVAVFCTRKTLETSKLSDSQKRRYRRIYRGLALAMIVSPLAAIVMTAFFGIYDRRLFFVESFALWAFAAYWAVRSRELYLSQAEWNAMTGQKPT